MLVNTTKNKVLAGRVRVLKSVFSQSIGLMFSKKDDCLALWFAFNKSRKVEVHMFFVFYSIDVFFLDEKGVVLEVKRNLRPWSMYRSSSLASVMVEVSKPGLPVDVGDVLALKA